MNAPFSRRSLGGLALMALAAWLSAVAAPTTMLADRRPMPALATLVPESFGTWRLDRAASGMLVEPALQRAIDAVYAQTLSRVYVDGQGERIMLAVAYGRDQSDSFQVHLPEGCYQGQGFAVNASDPALLRTRAGAIPAQRMVAERRERREAVTYWVVVGDRVGADDWARKKAKLAYALERTVPDGLLVRVSSIGRDPQAAFGMQGRFVDAMLGAMAPRERSVLLGARQP
jgi:EpsI family protein